MKKSGQVITKLYKVESWLKTAECQRSIWHGLFTEYQAVMEGASALSCREIEKRLARQQELMSQVKSAQLITIPGFCLNQDVTAICNILQGMKDALNWCLEDSITN